MIWNNELKISRLSSKKRVQKQMELPLFMKKASFFEKKFTREFLHGAGTVSDLAGH